MNILLKQHNNFKINNFFIIKLFFYSFPVILFFPSGYVTAHVSLLSITSLIFFYKNNIKIKIILVDYLIFALFFLSIFSTLKNISTLGNIIFIKSILDIRFAIFFLIIRNLLTNKIVNLKLLSIITLVSSTLLSLDIFLQHLIGHNILGFEPFEGRYNGFFEHEAIAGGYIQKNFLLSILSIFLLNLKKISKIIFITFLINILGLGILLSLDRMPFVIFVAIIIMLFVFIKNYRLLIFSNILILSALFSFIFFNYAIVNKRYEYSNRDINFYKILNLPIIKNIIKDSEKKNNILSKGDKLFHGDYSKLYNAAYLVFLKNYWTGSGVKSFIYECTKIPPDTLNISCNNHPHNIYFEILVNLGIVGMLVFVIFLYFLINIIIKNLLKNKVDNNDKIILILFLTIFISELMPFRSYGSIFQTINGSIFWFSLGLISYVNNIVANKFNKI
jgi:O-antigen ligase